MQLRSSMLLVQATAEAKGRKESTARSWLASKRRRRKEQRMKANAELGISAELKPMMVRLNQTAYVFLTVCAKGAVTTQR